MKAIAEHQSILRTRLKNEGVSDVIVASLCESGYILNEVLSPGGSKQTVCVTDTFYGAKEIIGLIPLPAFLDYIAGKPYPAANTPTYNVQSLKQVQDILADGRHAPFFQKGWMSFRGQVREYTTQRSFPNPYVAAADRKERLILPSFWRRFRRDWNSRFDTDPPCTIFESVKGDFLIYYGIKDWQNLSRVNLKRYGLHTMSDLEDFPDPESQEYGRRWRMFKIDGALNSDLPLVEQHYGIDTCGLDITFDLGVAFFFATYRWEPRGEKVTYKKVPNEEHEGVVYAFVFRDPLIATRDMVQAVHAFDHIPPVRPVVQKCALPCFNSCNMNEAVADLNAVFYIDHAFDQSEIPEPGDLFPGKTQDPFYAAAIAIKREYPGVAPYTQFVEYDFG